MLVSKNQELSNKLKNEEDKLLTKYREQVQIYNEQNRKLDHQISEKNDTVNNKRYGVKEQKSINESKRNEISSLVNR